MPLVRLLAVAAYFVIAHHALDHGSRWLGGVALGLLVMIVFCGGLWRREPRAWIASVLLGALAGMLAWRGQAPTALLLVPAVFLALACRVFARTLLPGRTPLLVRMIEAVDGEPVDRFPPGVQAYATAQTLLWAIVLGCLSLANLVLGLCAVPGGVLERAGITPPAAIDAAAAATWGPWAIYLVVGGLLVGEFIYRQRRFPGRYDGPLDFIRRVARVTPARWAEVFQ